jgi:hypothetical protein
MLVPWAAWQDKYEEGLAAIQSRLEPLVGKAVTDESYRKQVGAADPENPKVEDSLEVRLQWSHWRQPRRLHDAAGRPLQRTASALRNTVFCDITDKLRAKSRSGRQAPRTPRWTTPCRCACNDPLAADSLADNHASGRLCGRPSPP